MKTTAKDLAAWLADQPGEQEGMAGEGGRVQGARRCD